MIYPLVRELAVDGVSVTVTCRVLKIARQPYYRWLAGPVTAACSGRAPCSPAKTLLALRRLAPGSW